MNQAPRGKQKAAQDLSNLFIVDNSSVRENRKRLLRGTNSSNNTSGSETRCEDSAEPLYREYHESEPKKFRRHGQLFSKASKEAEAETTSTYASRILGCNASIINNLHVYRNRKGFKPPQNFQVPRMQPAKEIVGGNSEDTVNTSSNTGGQLSPYVENLLSSTASKNPKKDEFQNSSKASEKCSDFVAPRVQKGGYKFTPNHSVGQLPKNDNNQHVVEVGKVSRSISSKGLNKVDLIPHEEGEVNISSSDFSCTSAAKTVTSFTSAKIFHNQVKFEDTNWVENFDGKEKVKRRREKRKSRKEKLLELESECFSEMRTIENASRKTEQSFDDNIASGILTLKPAISSSDKCPGADHKRYDSNQKNEESVVNAEDEMDEKIKFKTALVEDTEMKDTYMDVSFLSESQYMPLISPSPMKKTVEMLNLVSNKQYLPEITNLLDVTDKIDVPGTTDNVDLPYGMDQVDVHDSTPDTDGLNISESFASQSSSVKHDLTDQLNTNRHQKLEIPAGAPEMSYSKKFVFKPKKPSSSEEKLPETKKFYDLTMFEYLGNGEPLNVESETKMVPEKLDVSEEAYSSAVDVLRNDGRKVVPRSVSKTKRFSTPRQKVSNASSDSPATGKNALKVYEVLSLSNIESFRSGLSITDCLIDRDLRNLLEYKQNILNQAVTLSKLVIAPAYSTFCQRHLREYFRQNLNPGIQEQFKLSPEAYFSRLGYLTFSGLKLLKHSPQHDKFVSKLMPLKFDICFYIGFPAKKHLFNNFNKNDIWAIILNRSFVVNSGVDGMKILLARSMMPWPLWNGHLQVQVIATFGGQAHDIKGQKSNEVSPKSVFGLTCYNSSFCVIRICQAVNELDCVSVVQECFPEIPYLEPSCVPNELPGLLQGLCNPMKNTRSSKTSQDVLIESCNFDKAFSLAGKVATEFQLNESQKKALVQFCSSLCSLEHKNFSTLIHGVFGSGKSLFLAVLCHFVTTLLDQNLLLDSKFSLLICSGTNVAVDNVLIKYLDIAFAETKQESSLLDEKVMERVLRIGNVQKIAIPILKYSLHFDVVSDTTKQLNMRLKKENLKPKERELLLKLRLSEKHVGRESRVMGAQIVGVTCASCVSPHLNPFKASVLIIDEASQLTECMTHLAISRFKPKRLVLVGDPKQLPPVLPDAAPAQKPAFRDKQSSSIAMQTTLFQRLISSGIEPIVLNTQYRCHPQISRLCNNLFYDATLEDAVEERERESLLKVVDPKGSSLSNAVLVNISNGVEQLNSSGSSSKSFVNSQEADFCCQLVVNAVNSQNVAPADIGVICFYRAQVSLITEKLTRAFSNLGVTSFDDVTMPLVSTVDAFQGGERKMIVLCTTRTKSSNIPAFFDERRDDILEFFCNSNRLNVALSRAKNNLVLLCNLSLIVGTSAIEGNVWLRLYELIGKHGTVYKNVQHISSLLGIENASSLNVTSL